jgi:hypothetical protein
MNRIKKNLLFISVTCSVTCFVALPAGIAASSDAAQTSSRAAFKLRVSQLQQNAQTNDLLTEDSACMQRRMRLDAPVLRQLALARKQINGVTAVHYIVPGGAKGIGL